MAVRSYDGVDDRTVFTTSGFGTIGSNAHTILVLAKPATISVNAAYITCMAIGGADVYAYIRNAGAVPGRLFDGNTGTDISSASAIVTASAWQVFGVSDGLGTSTPRFHRKELGAGSWSHVDASTTMTDLSGTPARIVIGSLSETSSQPYNGLMALAAIWDSVALSDTDWENIESNATTAFVLTLSPDALYELTQDATGTAIEDLAGANEQSSQTGTSVVTGDDPAWEFQSGGAAEKQSFYVSRRRTVRR